MINKITDSNFSSYGISKESQTKVTKQTEEKDQNDGVILETSKPTDKKVTYENPTVKKLNADEIAKLWDETNKATESLRSIVKDLLQRQGMTFHESIGDKKVVKIDEQTKSDAAALIADDGALGVKAVSDRIVAFAKSISGGDKSKIAMLRNAIKQGFGEAAKTLNSELPDVSKRTYDEVMKQLDIWENEGNTETA